MPTFYPSIPPSLSEWALQQPLFFTATAPTHGKHINVSPKGLPSSSLIVLSPNKCAYLDATGSGCETIAHLYENGRCTLMWCSFGASPRIMRWFCTGRVTELAEGSREWEEKRGWFSGEIQGARAVIELDVWKVQTSCGYGVPVLKGEKKGVMEGDGGDKDERDEKEDGASLEKGKGNGWRDRPTLTYWGKKTMKMEGGRGMENYRAKNNVRSLDGLPGFKTGRRFWGERSLVFGDLKARWRKIGREWRVMVVGWTLMALLIWGSVLMGLVEIGIRIRA